jgi:hypothetical protein
MKHLTTRNLLVAAIALLVLFNLQLFIAPTVLAQARPQYKAVMCKSLQEIQTALDTNTAQGWEYVGAMGSTVMIFRK